MSISKKLDNAAGRLLNAYHRHAVSIYLVTIAIFAFFIFTYYNSKALQITTEVVAETEVVEYSLPVNRPTRYRLPAGKIELVSTSLEVPRWNGPLECNELFEIQISPTCENCESAASSVRIRQSTTPAGHLRIVWEKEANAASGIPVELVNPLRQIEDSIVQIGYESCEPLGDFRSTQLGANLLLGDQIPSVTINAVDSVQEPILRGGTVSFFGRAVANDNRYAIASELLREGDVVSLETGYDTNASPLTWIQLTHDPTKYKKPAFDLIARAAANEVHITQNQSSEGFKVGVGLVDQITSEPLMLLIYGALLIWGMLLNSRIEPEVTEVKVKNLKKKIKEAL